jgi:hypothetical protein
MEIRKGHTVSMSAKEREVVAFAKRVVDANGEGRRCWEVDDICRKGGSARQILPASLRDRSFVSAFREYEGEE